MGNSTRHFNQYSILEKSYKAFRFISQLLEELSDRACRVVGHRSAEGRLVVECLELLR